MYGILVNGYLMVDKVHGFNPLTDIIKDDKLTAPNYLLWKRKSYFVLPAEGVDCIFETSKP